MATLEVLFQPLGGSPVEKIFKHKPLGIIYRIETPTVVSFVMGEAEDAGVEAGWQILRVGNQDINGMSFEAVCRAFWEGAKDLTESLIMRDHPPDTTSIANMILWWRPPDPLQAAEILQTFGYSALGPTKWKDVTQPSVSLQLTRKHVIAGQESDGAHAWYDIHGRLSRDSYSQDWSWVVPRRQVHLRRLLHDPVRLELGGAYDHLFRTERSTPSPRPQSTAVKLGAWLKTLAELINSCRLSPALTAAVLTFLEAPQICETHTRNRSLLPGGDHGRSSPKLGLTESLQQPDELLEDEDFLLDDDCDDEMPSLPPISQDASKLQFGHLLPHHSPICSQDASKLELGNWRQVVHISGHQIIRDLI